MGRPDATIDANSDAQRIRNLLAAPRSAQGVLTLKQAADAAKPGDRVWLAPATFRHPQRALFSEGVTVVALETVFDGITLHADELVLEDVTLRRARLYARRLEHCGDQPDRSSVLSEDVSLALRTVGGGEQRPTPGVDTRLRGFDRVDGLQLARGIAILSTVTGPLQKSIKARRRMASSELAEQWDKPGLMVAAGVIVHEWRDATDGEAKSLYESLRELIVTIVGPRPVETEGRWPHWSEESNARFAEWRWTDRAGLFLIAPMGPTGGPIELTVRSC